MSLLVAGLINIETTLKIDEFPIHYHPVRYPFFGVESVVSGVGYNIAKALTILGDKVVFLSLIGRDTFGNLVTNALEADDIPLEGVLKLLKQTPQSVVLYDASGKRMIHTDLKDIQDVSYPIESFTSALKQCELAILSNINFTRPYLSVAKQAGVPIATDIHAISQLDDDYNRDYMTYADILFMSHERLPTTPELWVRQLQARYDNSIIVVGLGDEGCLLAVRADNFLERIPSRTLRPVMNTVGAGDALFSAFVHNFIRSKDPYSAIQKAVLFAGYKVGSVGGSEGFLTHEQLESYFSQTTKGADL